MIEPKEGLFPETPPVREVRLASEVVCSSPPDMGLGVGGRMRQEIFPDDYGWETWDTTRIGRADVRLVHADAWGALTGEAPPPTPVSAQAYTDAGLPWFDLYSERGDLPASQRLAGLRSVDELDHHDDQLMAAPPWQVTFLSGDA